MVDEFPDNDNRLDSYSIACVSDIIKSLKCNYRYFKTEKFFRIFETINNYTFWLHVSLKFGLVDLMLYVKDDDTILTPCGSFNWIVVDIGYSPKPLGLPCFTNYKQLNIILQNGIDIYEDFKKEVIKEYSCLVDQKDETDLGGNSGSLETGK
jgi:hypothetical protein